MLKPDVSPLIGAIFHEDTPQSECGFIREIADALENGELWPRQLHASGEAAKVLNSVAYAALCEVIQAQNDVAEGLMMQKIKGNFGKEEAEKAKTLVEQNTKMKLKGKMVDLGKKGKDEEWVKVKAELEDAGVVGKGKEKVYEKVVNNKPLFGKT